jgi:hypothetical protein
MTAEHKERLRNAIIAWLAEQPTFGPSIGALTMFLRQAQAIAFEIREEDVAEAVAFLEGYKFIRIEVAALGSTRKLFPTPEGILYHERAQG